MPYAFAKSPTPAYNTEKFPEFYEKGELPLDDQGLFRPLEFIARKGTLFQILSQFPKNVWKVSTRDYPFPVFVNSHFLQPTKITVERTELFPTACEILKSLSFFVSQNIDYLWGGNDFPSNPQMLKLYPPPQPLVGKMEKIWTKQGLDCTGLVYIATNGMAKEGVPMPRNSGDQLKLGIGIAIAGKKSEEIVPLLKPLDLIAWKGHVLLVGENKTVYEAHRDFGVRIMDLSDRLNEIMITRAPEDIYKDGFAIRRWHPEMV